MDGLKWVYFLRLKEPPELYVPLKGSKIAPFNKAIRKVPMREKKKAVLLGVQW